MSALFVFFITILVLWRLYRIGLMIFSRDFLLAISIGLLVLAGIDFISTGITFWYTHKVTGRISPMLELMLPETAIWLIACILMKSYHDRRFLSQAQKFVILLSTIAAILFSIYNYHKLIINIFF